jgi:sulfoxide reductase heme-binding subunit YedZ
MVSDKLLNRGIKPLLFVVCLLPLGQLAWGVIYDKLGANPIEVFTRSTGEWTLRFLLVTLTITPLRQLTGASWLIKLRRMLGLFAFFYALVHLTSYLWLDQFFDWGEILRDIIKRPFITVGMTAFLLMLPLALTSTNRMMRRLGGNWRRLHRLIYLIAPLAVLHYFWLVKADIRLPVIYALILGVLLGYRLYRVVVGRATEATALSSTARRGVAEDAQR